MKYKTQNGLSLRHIDDNGYMLVDKSPILKAGILEYFGSELLPENSDTVDGVEVDKDKIYKVYIPLEEIEKAKDTFKLLPIVDGHTWLGDEGEDPKDYQEGSTGENVFIENNMLYVPLKITGKKMIDEIESGDKEELSSSYYNRFVKSDDSEYDFIARDIKGNHLALVDKGRCGSAVRVLNNKAKERKDMKAVDEDNIEWITVNGVHIPLKKGEGSKGEQIDKFFAERAKKEAESAMTKSEKEATKLMSDFHKGKITEEEFTKGYKEWKSKSSERNTKKEHTIQDISSAYSEGKRKRANEKFNAIYKEYRDAMKKTRDEKKRNDIEQKAIEAFFADKVGKGKNYDDYYNYWMTMPKEDLDNFDKIYTDSKNRENAFKSLSKQKDINNDIPSKGGVPKKSGEEGSYNVNKGAENMALKSKSKNEAILELDGKRINLDQFFDEEKQEKEGEEAIHEDSIIENEDKREIIREIMAIAGKADTDFEGGEDEKVETIAKLAEQLAYKPSEDSETDNEDTVEDEDEKEEILEEKEEGVKVANYDAMFAKISNAVKAERDRQEAALVKAYNSVRAVIGDFNPFGMSEKAMYSKALNHLGVSLDGKETVKEMSAMLKACSSIHSKVDNGFNYSDVSSEEIELNI